MITDRTIADVKAALALKQRGLPFTDDEKEQLERGTFTVNTINRIATMQSVLRSNISDAGYYIENPIDIEVFTKNDLFLQKDLDLMIANAIYLREAFLSKETTPDSIRPELHFEEINKLEQLIDDLWVLYTEIEPNAPECDDFETGEKN